MQNLRALCALLIIAASCLYGQINRTTADLLQQGDANTIADAGGSDAYTGCPVLSVSAYKAGQVIWLKPNTANTGAATLNVCGLGVKNIKQSDGTTDPQDGQLATGTYQQLVYDGTRFRIPVSGTTAALLSTLLVPGSDGCIAPTLNSGSVEVPFAATTCLPPLAIAWAGKQSHVPSATQSITAVSNTVLANGNNVAVSPTSNFTLTTTPTIANGSDGDWVRICNVNTTNTLTIQDEAVLAGSNIRNGGTNLALGPRACRVLVYETALGDWVVDSGGGGATIASTSNVLKGNGSGGAVAATSGTDFAPATSGTSILKGNGAGGFSNAVSGIDYAISPLTTKGDLWTYDTGQVRLGVGADGTVLAADSAAAKGVSYKTAKMPVVVNYGFATINSGGTGALGGNWLIGTGNNTGFTSSGSGPMYGSALTMADAVTSNANNYFTLPTDWDGGTVSIKAWGYPSSGGTNGQIVRMTAVADCRISGTDAANTFTYSTAQNLDVTVSNATAGVQNEGQLTSLTMNNCTGGGKMVFFKIGRLGGDAADTLAATWNMTGIQIKYYVTATLQ
jgi:hypothetical protein